MGGAELWARQVVRHLRDNGYRQQVIAVTDGGGASRSGRWENVPLIVHHGSDILAGGPALARTLDSIRELLACERPDVVLVSNFGHASLALLGLVRSSIQCPIVPIAHNVWPADAASSGSPLDLTARRAAGFIAFDDHVADWLAERWPSTEVTRIPLAMPPQDAPARPLPATPRSLFCGRLSEEKGPLVLVDAMASLIQSHPAARLVMVGDGHQRAAIEDRVHALDLSNHVRLLGAVPPGEIAALIDESYLVCIPSLSEGFGLVPLEAAWRARPVVASRVGGLVRNIADGETGLLVAPGDPEALARALADLLSNRDRAEAMGLAGRARAKARPGWSRHVAEFESAIEAVTSVGDRDARSALG